MLAVTLRLVIRSARRGDVEVSLCGEMAGDPLSTILLIGMGLQKLSMSAANIPEIKKIIRSVNMSDAQRIAKRVLRFETEREVVNYLRDETRKILPEAV